MKILITGGSGFVGYRLCEKFVSANNEVDYTFLSHGCEIPGARGIRADVSDAAQAAGLSETKYGAIIHCAALANVDLCEKDHALADRHNIIATENMLALAKKHGATFVYISTAHVFPASPSSRAYTEEDVPSLELAPNYYGRTKLEGEILVRDSSVPYLILRIDQPYYWKKEWQKDNTVTRTISKLQKGEKATEVTDWRNCPTFVPSFCELAMRLVSKGATGIFHATGPEYISRFDWAVKVARIFGFPEEGILPVSAASFNLAAARPNVQLDSRKAYALAGMENANLEKGLEQMRREWEEKTGNEKAE